MQVGWYWKNQGMAFNRYLDTIVIKNRSIIESVGILLGIYMDNVIWIKSFMTEKSHDEKFV